MIEGQLPVTSLEKPPPELIIRAQTALRTDWKELWAYRELFFFFAWRDIKVRYKQTAIGAGWAIFQPFMTMIVFTVFFNKVAGVKSPNHIPYAIFSYSGLLFWNFYSAALSASANSLVGNQSVITKIYFPRVILPFATMIVALIDFGFASLVYVGLLFYYQIVPGVAGVLLVVPMVVLTFLTAAGIGLFFGALNVKYRDVRFVVPFMLQLLLFLTPIIYPLTLVPQRFRWILYLNPLTGVIQTVRAGTLHEGSIDWNGLGLSTVAAAVMLALGFAYFKTQERRFADII